MGVYSFTQSIMKANLSAVEGEINALVDEYRAQCLWFLRPDYYPATRDERLRILASIQRHGDRAAHIRAAALRKCLLHSFSGESAAS